MNKDVLNKAIIHLSRDKKLKKLIDKYPKPKFEINNNHFDALTKSIIYQQLSGKVAKIIYVRYVNLFNKKVPIAKDCLKINEEKLRSIGLSKQKITYIYNVSEFFINNQNQFDFHNMAEQDIRKNLISIKGIGPWTIDMFMMFTIFKLDVLPVGDLGIKKAFKELFNLDKLPSDKFMTVSSEKWRPYRTIACCYLWMIVDDGDVW